MKVLWVGDAGVASGFAECTHQVCTEMVNVGWEVHVLGINYMGDPHNYPFNIYPCRQPFDGGFDLWGQTRIRVLADRLEPDLIVLLNDPWNIPPYVEAINKLLEHRRYTKTYLWEPKIITWLAVDAENQKGKEQLSGLDHVITWTQWGADQLVKGGYTGPYSVIPLGVDLNTFNPVVQSEAREQILPAKLRDKFIIGMVGRNQVRKRLDLAIKYFAEWIRTYNVPDACLFIHTAPTGDNGFDLPSLIDYYGVNGKVIISCTENLGVGLNPNLMKYIYSAFDAYWCTSQAEGWCLPALEAMACGVPVICNNSGPISEWTKGAALQVEANQEVLTAPQNNLMYTIGRMPDMQASIEALSQLYIDHNLRVKLGIGGLARASQFQWKEIRQKFVALCREIVYTSGDANL